MRNDSLLIKTHVFRLRELAISHARVFDKPECTGYSGSPSTPQMPKVECMKSVASRIAFSLILSLFVTLILTAAEPNFSGTWKLNLAKSQLSGVAYTFENKPSGIWHYNGGGFDTDFDLTGKEYTMPSGMGVVGKELSPTSWELTF